MFVIEKVEGSWEGGRGSRSEAVKDFRKRDGGGGEEGLADGVRSTGPSAT